jgi:hypothetical protein
MIEGLWIVQYESVKGGDGGVIVFVKGQVLGGDNGFIYTGTYKSDGKMISALVLVRNFAPGIVSVLGIEGVVELTVQGTVEGKVIKGSASLIDQEGPRMVMKLTKVTDLAL